MTLSSRRGFTLVELIIGIGIFVLLTSVISWILITSLRSSSVIFDQLDAQNGGRRVLQEVVDDVRRGETSNVGGYPIASASSTALILFANIDGDSDRERVRYFLENNQLKKGVTQPTGNPTVYNTATERIVVLASNVKNKEQGVPTFQYFNSSYSGTQAALTYPISLTQIRMVKIQLELDKNSTKSPVLLHMEATADIRNLKDN